MDWKLILGWFFVVLGSLGLSYPKGEFSEVAKVLMMFMGFYLIINSEKEENNHKK